MREPGSRNYQLFREAILREKQVVCVYDGYRRELCPLVIGRKNGEESVLAYQFAGDSKDGPCTGAWKCLKLAKVTAATLRAGPWHEGSGHAKDQTCVDEVDLDINIHVRKHRAVVLPFKRR